VEFDVGGWIGHAVGGCEMGRGQFNGPEAALPGRSSVIGEGAVRRINIEAERLFVFS